MQILNHLPPVFIANIGFVLTYQSIDKNCLFEGGVY